MSVWIVEVINRFKIWNAFLSDFSLENMILNGNDILETQLLNDRKACSPTWVELFLSMRVQRIAIGKFPSIALAKKREPFDKLRINYGGKAAQIKTFSKYTDTVDNFDKLQKKIRSKKNERIWYLFQKIIS